MGFLSYHVEIETKTDTSELVEKFRSDVEDGDPRSGNKWSVSETHFRGKINGDTFLISRNFKGRNMFSPIISVKMLPNRVLLDFKVSPVSKLFLLIFGTVLNSILIPSLLRIGGYNELLVFIGSQILIALIFQIDLWRLYKSRLNEIKELINAP